MIPLKVDSSLTSNWIAFKHDFKIYWENYNKTNGTKSETKVLVFLNVIGESGLTLINQLHLTDYQRNDFNELITALDSHCLLLIKENEQSLFNNRSDFFQLEQQKRQSFNSYLMQLQELAKLCAFGEDQDTMVLDRILYGVTDEDIQHQLKKLQGFNLENVIDLCRMTEALKHHQNDGQNIAVIPLSYSSTECVLQNDSGCNIAQPSFNMRPENMCGISFFHPTWLQRFANSKSFLIVYGLLGTIQAMAFLYFVVTLTTIEKRFKIPSQTTGIIISGNEISQILLSLILSYAGGQRNRPRWIAWGVVFCALSCFILALPHFIYGPGEDALHLTLEYMHRNDHKNVALNTSEPLSIKSANKLCVGKLEDDECDELFSIVPLVLIFLSQFVLGIGNTLYYSLGQTYLDDNTKKTNTPKMLAYAMSLRMFGPVVGFLLGYISLNIYIDPTKTPLINNKDPRWLGAWWLGWIILGFSMLLFSWLIGMFPKELPKMRLLRQSSETPKALYCDNNDDTPLQGNQDKSSDSKDVPKLKDFPTALLRLLKNKLLMYNILSGIFYILGSSGYITFLSKYMEVQFNKNSADATIVTGPVTIIGMVSGFLLSGFVISKYRPAPRKLFFWNVIVGIGYMLGQISYLFLTCNKSSILNELGALNLTSNCNSNCICDGVPYSPVCNDKTGITYFSPCHAGCNSWNDGKKLYSNCTCAAVPYDLSKSPGFLFTSTVKPDAMAKSTNSIGLAAFNNLKYSAVVTERIFESTSNTTDDSADDTDYNLFDEHILDHNHDYEEITMAETITVEYIDSNYSAAQTDYRNPEKSRYKRTVEKTFEREILENTMIPGACLAGCAYGFYMFTGISLLINWLGATGRIGNILLNFRVVAVEDKSFSQGLALMMISMFALIPGPILYGYIIDSTCLQWNYKCGSRGNCQLYDQTKFRQYLNLTALALTFVGVAFDVLVWYHGKSVELYGEESDTQKQNRRHQPITPLLTGKKT